MSRSWFGTIGSLALVVTPFVTACDRESLSSPDAVGIIASASNGEGAEARIAAQTDMEQARQALLAAQQTYSDVGSSDGTYAAFKVMTAGDVRYLEFGSPILFGRDAVLDLIQSDPPTYASTQTWHPIRVDVSADGNRGYTFGYTRIEGPFGAGGATEAFGGKYIAFWRRESDDTWHAIAYLHNFQVTLKETEAPVGFESPSYSHYRYFPNTDAAQELTALEGVDDAFAASALEVGPGQAFYDYAADDGAVLSGQPSIVFGRSEIEGTFATFPATGKLLWYAVDGDVADSGDLGFTIGLAETHTFNADGSPRVTFTKYLTVWKRLKTGEWRFEVDGGNGRPAS
jgi:ketosteroid isomerase-like protein